MVNQTLKSEKNTSNYYGLIAFLSFGIIILFSSIYFIAIDSNYEVPIIFGSLIIIYSAFILIKNKYEAPELILTNQYIQIGQLKYDYDQILEFDPFNNLKIIFDAEYIKSNFQDEFRYMNEFHFEDRLYKNLHDVKLYLEQVAIQKSSFQPITIEYPKTLPNKKDYTIRTINFYLKNGIIILFFLPIVIILLVYLPYKISNSVLVLMTMLILIIECLIMIQLFERAHFSFEIVNDVFVIHSPFIFWNKRIYKLNDIKHIETVTIEVGKSYLKGLRVWTNDYRYKIYNAESLSKRQLATLLSDFKKMGKSTRKNFIIV